MTIVWLTASPSFWPIRRDRMSLGPPGANGTMTRIGRSGSAAAAGLTLDTAPSASSAASMRGASFIALLLFSGRASHSVGVVDASLKAARQDLVFRALWQVARIN